MMVVVIVGIFKMTKEFILDKEIKITKQVNEDVLYIIRNRKRK